jgi:hypothetical protein
MMRAYEIIEGRYNNQRVKFFKLRKLERDRWIELGGFIAPIGIANKRLAKYAEEVLNERA